MMYFDDNVYPVLGSQSRVYVEGYEPDVWPASPVGVTVRVQLKILTKFLFWEKWESDHDFSSIIIDLRHSDAEKLVKEAVDFLVEEFASVVEAKNLKKQIVEGGNPKNALVAEKKVEVVRGEGNR